MGQNNLSAEQWQAIAEKLAEYCAAFCELVLMCDCEDCPLYDCSGCVGDTKIRSLQKAKKELGCE